MSKFDVSTNRIPFGLLTTEEQAELIEAAGVKGAWVECNSALVPKWHDTTSNVLWRMDCAYRVHLPAAPVVPEASTYTGPRDCAHCHSPKNASLRCFDDDCYDYSRFIPPPVTVEPPKPEPVVGNQMSADECNSCGCVLPFGDYQIVGDGAVEDVKRFCRKCEAAKASVKVKPPAPKRIEPLVNRDKYTSRQAVNLYWAKLNELIEAVNEMRKDGAK